jgi:uncharacterized protein (TIGR02598 family)
VNRRHGFTLVEVALAVAIAAVALTALLGVAIQALRTGRRGVDDSVVATIASDLFAGLRAGSYDSLSSTTAVYDSKGDVPSAPDYRGDYFRCYTVVTSYSAPADSLSNYYKRIELRFTWPSPTNNYPSPCTNSFYTLVSRLE